MGSTDQRISGTPDLPMGQWESFIWDQHDETLGRFIGVLNKNALRILKIVLRDVKNI
jgi:hypothetical protein